MHSIKRWLARSQYTVALVLSVFLVPLPLGADELRGQIVFSGKPPFAALLYADDKQSVTDTALIDQQDREFTQRLVVVGSSGSVTFKNSDSVDHNIFANDLKHNVSFDVGLMPPGSQSTIDPAWTDGLLVRIGCKIHPKMRSYLSTVNSRHFQVFEFQKGTKEYPVLIDEIPENIETFTLVLPKYDVIEVSIAPGENKTVAIMKKGKERGSIILKRL